MYVTCVPRTYAVMVPVHAMGGALKATLSVEFVPLTIVLRQFKEVSVPLSVRYCKDKQPLRLKIGPSPCQRMRPYPLEVL